jgi:hypothetical protein
MESARKYAAFLIVLLLGYALAPPRARGRSGVSLRGTAHDQGGGDITGATVVLYSADQVFIQTSDEMGTFGFTDLPPGGYSLEVNGFGFMTKTIENIVITSKHPDSISVMLSPGKGNGCVMDPQSYGFPGAPTSVSYNPRIDVQVQGVVRGYQEGRPAFFLPNATIEIISKTGKSLVIASNDKGKFSVTAELEPGNYQVYVAHDGYWTGPPLRFWISRENLSEISLGIATVDTPNACREHLPFIEKP